ncbi:unnamed protein product [Rangifer tarandus platyrhynchus]|uniref:Basic proline-rich protein-like n=2 Tax=Rangifer tarandus platyrhynchus TaxID=3082113 RepID=A0ABN8YDI9_RANTA|nr:unnamed protein product [Rangifer tarandus platyrhynchus]CAI9696329.1 unnamed protein product [Rangifer tarandus platyrhynchus]
MRPPHLSRSRWNSLTAAARLIHTATFLPHAPSETRASEGGGLERTPATTRPPPTPAPSPVGKAPPPPASLPFTPPVCPPRQPLPARPARTERGAGLPSAAAGPQPLELVTTGGGDRAGQWAAGGSPAGRGRTGRPRGAGSRKVLPNTVGLLRLLLNGSGPGGGGGSDIPGERSRRRRLLLHSLLASLPWRAHRAPRPFSHLPPPAPTHTPRNLKPYGSRGRVTHPPSLPATSGGPVPPPFPGARCRAGLSNGGHSGSLALTDLSLSPELYLSISPGAHRRNAHARALPHTRPGAERRRNLDGARARAPAPPSPQSLAPAALTSRRLPRRAPGWAPPLLSSPGSLGRRERRSRREGASARGRVLARVQAPPLASAPPPPPSSSASPIHWFPLLLHSFSPFPFYPLA